MSKIGSDTTWAKSRGNPAHKLAFIAEIPARLADAELAMGWRLRNMLASPGVALPWWDQDVWAQRLGYSQQDARLSAGVFRALRESNLRLLESVPRAHGGWSAMGSTRHADGKRSRSSSAWKRHTT